MDCGKTRELLSAFHDGELAPADRARVEEHLRGCGECSAALARLAEIDAGVGVPDPGPEYWERFNRRVMERVEKERAEGEPAPEKARRPERGWARRRLPYFIPVVAAAALLFVVVRQTGIDPLSRTSAPTAPPTAVQESSGAAQDEAAKRPQETPSETSSRESRPEAPPEIRPSASRAPRRDAADAGRAAGVAAAPRESAPPVAAPPAAGPPAAAPAAMDAGMKGSQEQASLYEKERKSDRLAAAPAGLPDPVAETGKAERAMSKSIASAAPEGVSSPCEEARSFADRGRLEEAETAQRACLARGNPPEAQEKGMVFLAELLDRQSRFSEADSVLEETRKLFPRGRALAPYLERRSGVQGRPLP